MARVRRNTARLTVVPAAGDEASTIGGRARIYREALQRRELSPKSVALYAREVWRAEWWCEQAGQDLRFVPAELFGEYVAGRPKSWSTRAQIRKALKHYWEIFGRADPPLWMVRVPKKPRMVCRALTDDDAARLAKAARERGGKAGFAVLLGLYQALRREEISKVTWADFSADGWLYVLGKGAKPEKIPLHPVVIDALAELEREHPVWVFPGQGRTVSGPVCPTTVWNWIVRLADELGLEGVTPHRLRHTCLATANDATGDLRAVQDFARHSDIDTTAGYTRSTEKRLRLVIDSLSYEGRPPELPAVGYQQLIAGLEGDANVPAWLELGLVLVDAGGWRFEISDAMALWRCEARPELWATARAGVDGPSFDLFRADTDDEATNWTRASAAELVQAVADLAAGRTPAPTARLGPWIEQEWLERLAGGRQLLEVH